MVRFSGIVFAAVLTVWSSMLSASEKMPITGKLVLVCAPHDVAVEAMEKQGKKIVVKFKDVGGGLHCVDSKDVQGFAIAGADKKFVWAKAEIVKPQDGAKADTIEVSSKEVPEPVAVRYAWADNPVCNLYNDVLLPVTPFRTDDWKGVTAGVNVTP